MSSTRKVAKNSLWLIVQPLLLNLISLAATAYIARVLGKVDYGKFIFAFAFVAMFMPLINMGLRAITVREIAKDKANALEYANKILATRFWLALPTIILIALVVNIVGYDEQTKLIVYIASLNVIIASVASTFQDVFQAFENMKYVAYSQFFGGIILTILSVLLLFLGFGIVGLTMAYVFGSVITLLMAYWYVKTIIGRPLFQFDWAFTKEKIIRGAPFFYPSIVALAGVKIGVILLAKMSGNASVGVFGAANNLVEKLWIISDGICTALFPALVSLYQKSQKDAVHLYSQYYEYLLMLALPIAIGTTILSKPIILLIYGQEYIAAVPVLQILVWWLFISFLSSIQSLTLNAIHLEKKSALVSIITTPLYITLNLLLIPTFQEKGTAWANLLSILCSFVLLTYFVKVHFVSMLISWNRLARITSSAALMGIIVYWLREWNLFISIIAGGVIYFSAALVLNVVDMNQLKKLKSIVLNKVGLLMVGKSSVEEETR